MSRFTRCFIIFVVIVLSLCSSLVAPAMYGRLSNATAAGEVYADGIFDGAGRIAVRILDAETWRFADTQVRRNAPGLAAAFAYLLLRERDLRQMRAVIKGKRLGSAPELIRAATGAAEPEAA